MKTKITLPLVTFSVSVGKFEMNYLRACVRVCQCVSVCLSGC